MTVVKPGKEFEILATNDLGESISSSPAISNGRIYLRTFDALYAIGNSARSVVRGARPSALARPAQRRFADGQLAARLFVVRDLEAQVLDHLVVGRRGLALGRQIIADEDRIGRIQSQRLQAAQVQLAAAGDAQSRDRDWRSGTWPAPSGNSAG